MLLLGRTAVRLALETKNPSSNQGRRGTLRGTTLLYGTQAARSMRGSGRTRCRLGSNDHPSPAVLPGEFGLRVASKPGRACTNCPGSLEAGLLLRLNAYHYVFIQPVDPEGFEPSTFSMPLRRAPNCAMGPFCCLGAGRCCKVDLEGFEPSTFSVRLRRAPNCATGPQVPGIVPDATRDCQGNGLFCAQNRHSCRRSAWHASCIECQVARPAPTTV
jgi:hypothetical protein